MAPLAVTAVTKLAQAVELSVAHGLITPVLIKAKLDLSLLLVKARTRQCSLEQFLLFFHEERGKQEPLAHCPALPGPSSSYFHGHKGCMARLSPPRFALGFLVIPPSPVAAQAGRQRQPIEPRQPSPPTPIRPASQGPLPDPALPGASPRHLHLMIIRG